MPQLARHGGRGEEGGERRRNAVPDPGAARHLGGGDLGRRAGHEDLVCDIKGLARQHLFARLIAQAARQLHHAVAGDAHQDGVGGRRRHHLGRGGVAQHHRRGRLGGAQRVHMLAVGDDAGVGEADGAGEIGDVEVGTVGPAVDDALRRLLPDPAYTVETQPDIETLVLQSGVRE